MGSSCEESSFAIPSLSPRFFHPLLHRLDKVDAIVIGAGVVGLAIARALALGGHETIVLERADAIGTGTSSRNSEVIHAGIYYATDSSKARLCVRGREQLYRFCEQRGIAHRRCGKLIVATSGAQRPALDAIAARAARNGVADLRRVDARELQRLEPALDAVAGLVSPSTGIVDSHGLMLALQGEIEAHGGAVVLRSPASRVTTGAGVHVVHVGGAAPVELAAPVVVNAAGLWAGAMAARIDALAPTNRPSLALAKGNYFALAGRAPFSRLIYPLPEPGGLGIHLTLDLAGQARFGPDVEWLDHADPAAVDYRVDPARGARFEASIRRYWPGLPAGALQPAYSGVRPKLNRADAADADFLIQGPAEHGIAGLVNLYGIESPGLTSCLALAEEVTERLRG